MTFLIESLDLKRYVVFRGLLTASVFLFVFPSLLTVTVRGLVSISIRDVKVREETKVLHSTVMGRATDTEHIHKTSCIHLKAHKICGYKFLENWGMLHPLLFFDYQLHRPILLHKTH